MYTANNSRKDIFSVASADRMEKFSNDDLTVFVSNILLQLGIPVNVKGYVYLREAIITKLHSSQIEISMTKILYPSVAEKFGTSASRVERAIRHAIKSSWNRIDQSYRDKFCSYPLLHFQKRPTNSEFIAMIAEYVTLMRN